MAKKIAASLLLSSFIVLGAASHAETAKKTAPGNGPYGAPQATFTSHHLGTDHAEGISTIDMNGDGYLDLLSGAYWYEDPGPQGGEWKQHQFRSVGTLGEFVSDCGEWAIDVNHDGAPDVVTTGWMTNGLFWYENPKKPDTMWERHFITDSFDTEGGWMADINGDGKPDVILAHYNHSGILWVDFSGPQPKVHHVGGKEQDGHGTGIADVNGDGKADILPPPAGSKTSMPTTINGSGMQTGTSVKPVSPSSATTSTTTARWTSFTAAATATASIGWSSREAAKIGSGSSTQ
jgi:hypothetical protein